jgi:hypothetical protein
MFVLVNLVLLFVGKAYSYSSGAPSYVCNTMTPLHPGSPQTAISPYLIQFNASTDGYSPGQIYDVVIKKQSSNVSDFKGFMCQVRQVGGLSAVGEFVQFDETTASILPCPTDKVELFRHCNAQISCFY